MQLSPLNILLFHKAQFKALHLYSQIDSSRLTFLYVPPPVYLIAVTLKTRTVSHHQKRSCTVMKCPREEIIADCRILLQKDVSTCVVNICFNFCYQFLYTVLWKYWKVLWKSKPSVCMVWFHTYVCYLFVERHEETICVCFPSFVLLLFRC